MKLYHAIVIRIGEATADIICMRTLKTRKTAKNCLERLFKLNNKHKKNRPSFESIKLGDNCWEDYGLWPKTWAKGEDVFESLENMKPGRTTRCELTSYQIVCTEL